MSITRAEADLSNVLKEIDVLQARAAELRVYIKLARVYSGGAADSGSGDDSQCATRTASSRATPGIAERATDFAVEYIQRQQAPQHTRVLSDEMTQAGIVIGSKNPLGNLSGFLSRDKRLKNSRTYGWSLANWLGDFPPDQSGAAEDDSQANEAA